jgi:hypothetical protein
MAKFSRPLKSAAQLGESAPDRHRFVEKKVLLTGESRLLKTRNGAVCFEASARMLPKICKSVVIALPESEPELREEYGRVLAEIGHAVVDLESVNISQFDAVLSVGTRILPGIPMTIAHSNGWVAAVSSVSDVNVAGDSDEYNPVAALAAASMGVAEVFKRLIRLKPERGQLVDATVLSLFNYEIAPSNLGPALPDLIEMDAVLAGVGAIGNGVIFLLNLLPIGGRLWFVDNQKYRDENVGTCLLVEQIAVGQDKALFAEQYLNSKITCKGFVDTVSDFRAKLGTEIEYPKLAIGSLDNIPARHEVQDLWPDMIIDGAISDFACQVSRHPFNEEGIACLKCLFRENSHKDAFLTASLVSGLSVERIQSRDAMVSEADVRAAPAAAQVRLKTQIGKPICSVVQEAVAIKISDSPIDFAPSVPFVACMSAAMIVAEIIKAAMGIKSNIEPRFQFDMLVGPANGLDLPQAADLKCECSARKKNIAKWRSLRRRM